VAKEQSQGHADFKLTPGGCRGGFCLDFGRTVSGLPGCTIFIAPGKVP